MIHLYSFVCLTSSTASECSPLVFHTSGGIASNPYRRSFSASRKPMPIPYRHQSTLRYRLSHRKWRHVAVDRPAHHSSSPSALAMCQSVRASFCGQPFPLFFSIFSFREKARNSTFALRIVLALRRSFGSLQSLNCATQANTACKSLKFLSLIACIITTI